MYCSQDEIQIFSTGDYNLIGGNITDFYNKNPPYELLKLLLKKCLTHKTCLLLALASSKRASKLYGLLYTVKHSPLCPVLWLRHKSQLFRICTVISLQSILSKTSWMQVERDVALPYQSNLSATCPGLSSIILPVAISSFL